MGILTTKRSIQMNFSNSMEMIETNLRDRAILNRKNKKTPTEAFEKNRLNEINIKY